MAATDDLSSQLLYHGTRADLKPGDLIEPHYRSNFGTRNKAGYVHLTSSLDTAAWGAEFSTRRRARQDLHGRTDRPDPGGPQSDKGRG